MRIEISATETGPLQTGLSDLRTDISGTIVALQKTRSQFYNMSGGVSNLSGAVSSLDRRIQREEQKLESVESLNRKTVNFLSNAVSTDVQVARMVSTNQKRFFREYERLRSVVPEEKSWWEQQVENWNRFWQGAGEALGNLVGKVGEVISTGLNYVKETVKKVFDTVVTFVKEHWVELVVGAAAIVVGAVIIAISGGTAAAFGAALLAGLKAAAVSAAIDGVISAAIAWVTGKDAGRAFGDGLASGFMMGGVFFALGSLSVLRSSLRARKAGAASKGKRVNMNHTQGNGYETWENKKFMKQYPNSDKQITIETMVDGKPVKFRIDQMAMDKNGNLVLRELKSSPTATLTKNQKAAWGRKLINNGRFGMLEHGGIVKGRAGKTLFPGGFQIPPGTRIEIVRPPMSFRNLERLNNLTKFTIYSGGSSGIITNNVKDIYDSNTVTKEGAYVFGGK